MGILYEDDSVEKVLKQWESESKASYERCMFMLVLSITLAVVDNIYFEEAYRDGISTVGIIALGVFFISIVGAVIKGTLNKRKKDV